MDSTVVVLGIVCVMAAIVGGGLELAGVKIPLVGSLPRQVMLAVFGALLLFVAWSNSSRDAAPAKDEAVAGAPVTSNGNSDEGPPRNTPDLSHVKEVLVVTDGKPAGRFWRDSVNSFVEYDETNTIVHEFNIVERTADALTLYDKSTNGWIRMDFGERTISTRANDREQFVRTGEIEKVDWTY